MTTHTFVKGDRVQTLTTNRKGTVINVWDDADVAVIRFDDAPGGSSSMLADELQEETCECGEWPLSEYGPVCPSCVANR